MEFVGEKERVDFTIINGQTTKAIVFEKTYAEIPSVKVLECDGSLNNPEDCTVVGCNVVAPDTNGRTGKLVITV